MGKEKVLNKFGKTVYSQGEEEKHILEFFDDYIGWFLDIGAHDGKSNSNTRALAECGWSGILVDGDPRTIECLKQLYQNKPNIHIIHNCVGTYDGEIIFYLGSDPSVSTLSSLHKNVWEKQAGVTYTPIIVPVVTYLTLIKPYPYKFDFISLDIEGMDWEVLRQIPLENSPVQLICIECGGNDRIKCLNHTKQFGFQLIYSNDENILVERKKRRTL